MITNVYIDGFNLYYRALKDTPFRWLDLRKLASGLVRATPCVEITDQVGIVWNGFQPPPQLAPQ